MSKRNPKNRNHKNNGNTTNTATPKTMPTPDNHESQSAIIIPLNFDEDDLIKVTNQMLYDKQADHSTEEAPTPQTYGYGSIEEIVDAANYYEEMSIIYAREKRALKRMVSELVRRLYEVTPDSEITFDIRALAESNTFEYEAMID